MKNVLFPHKFQLIGWVLFAVSLILGILWRIEVVPFISETVETVIIDFVVIGLALGSLFIVCSKEKVEDELVRDIRLTSMLYTIYVYVAIIIVCTLLINGVSYIEFAIYSLLLLPIIFVISYKVENYRYKNICKDEE